jgi:hypothetical protein
VREELRMHLEADDWFEFHHCSPGCSHYIG